jgi:hypothetical protein
MIDGANRHDSVMLAPLDDAQARGPLRDVNDFDVTKET